MAMDVLLVKDGTKLAAADPMSWDSLQAISQKEIMTATIRRARNPAHHRKLFALLNLIFEQQDKFATITELLNAIKIATGYFELGKTIDGLPYCVPKSISFASLCQAEFSQFYDKALDVILRKIVPNIKREDLEMRLHEILDGRNAMPTNQ